MFGLGILIPIISLLLDEKIIDNNEIINSIYNYLKINTYRDFVLFSLLILLLLSLIKAGFVLLLNFKQNRFLTNLTSSIAVKLFKNYLSSPYKFHLANNSSRLLKNLQIEISFFGNFCNSLLTLVSEIFLLFALALALLIIEPFGALIIGFSLGFLSLIFFQYTKKKSTYWGIEREKMGRGMSNEDFGRFSLPYLRKNSQNEVGTGLGLNICLAIMKEHGFKITCEKSGLENGTKIKIKVKND